MNIEATLKSKFDNDSIGHFYIVEPGRITQDTSPIYNWTENLVANLLDIKNIINHEDFLYVEPSNDSSKYTLEDFRPFFNFLTYKATRASRKIIIIKAADKISTLIANKLLKTLEEPPVAATIFLINDNKTSLLETIVSRSIKLRVPLLGNMTHENGINELQHIASLPMHQIIEKLKNSNHEQKQIINSLLSLCSETNVPYPQLHKIQNLLKEFQEDILYHNAATHRLYALATIIKDLNL